MSVNSFLIKSSSLGFESLWIEPDSLYPPQEIAIGAYFLGVEIPLVAALNVLIYSYSATGTITSYLGTIRHWREEQAATATAKKQGAS